MQEIYKSDAWDSENTLTQFYEVVEDCPYCEGIGYYSFGKGKYECSECGGEGKIASYE